MVPVRLWLRNFLSYGEEGQAVDLSGVHVAALVGPNGAGKSSLLDAITWALFGKARAANEELVRKGATEAEVLLEFSVDGQLYRVRRRYSRRARQHAVTLEQHDPQTGNWRPLVANNSVTAVNKELQRLLRMDYDTFVHTVFLLQGRHGEFMMLTPAERRDTLASILGLGDYEQWREKAVQRLRELDGQIRVAQQEIERIAEELRNRPQWEAQLSAKQRELDDARQRHETVCEERQRWQRERERLMQHDTERRNLRQSVADWERQIQAAQQRIAALQQQRQRLQAIAAQRDAIKAAVNEYRQKQAEEAHFRQIERTYQSLTQRRQQLHHAVEQARLLLENELNLLRQRRADCERELAETERLLLQRPEVERQLQALQHARDELALWSEKQKQWMELQQRKHAAERRIGEERAALVRREGELLSAQRRCEDAIQHKTTYRERARQLDEAIKRLAEWQQRAEQVQQERERTATRLATLRAQRAETERQRQETQDKLRLLQEHADEPRCPLCENLLTPERLAMLQERLKEELQALQAQLTAQDDAYTQLERHIAQLDAFLREAQKELEKRADLERQKGEVARALEDIARTETQLQTLRAQFAELQRQKVAAERRWQQWRAELESEERAIGYDQQKHAQAQQQVEALARAETVAKQLTEAQQKAQRLRDEIARLDEQMRALQQRLDAGDYAEGERRQLQEVESALAALNYDPERHEQLRQWLRDHQPVLQQEQQLRDAEAQLPQVEEQLEQERQHLAALRQRVDDGRERLRALDAELQRWDQVEAQLAAAERQVRESEEALQKLNGEVQVLRARLEELKKREREMVRRRDEIAEWQQERQDYELLAEAFGRNGIPKEVLKVAVQWLEQEANELLMRLTGGKMFLRFVLTQPRQSGDGVRETLDIVVADPLGDRPYQSYSGGEKFRIDFAVRIALARLVARRAGAALRTLVIDEGFGSQDKEGLEAMVDAVQTIAREFDRVLVVTHLEELRDQFPTLIEVTKDSKGSKCRKIDRSGAMPVDISAS
ncbi:putative DNA double-strand break repair Rad50 ATPase [bacterium HR17]|uniref:Putative DNA double-strand break repair Rad50 ATPase n=1 Tax=Candidatus Fervidibacter japonicus TaxID=2035412 RepID=A0A2H5XE54_9BACT|nr:putative DNA double-strand break repair Rad50 ATPase [bacterium HR17]